MEKIQIHSEFLNDGVSATSQETGFEDTVEDIVEDTVNETELKNFTALPEEPNFLELKYKLRYTDEEIQL